MSFYVLVLQHSTRKVTLQRSLAFLFSSFPIVLHIIFPFLATNVFHVFIKTRKLVLLLHWNICSIFNFKTKRNKYGEFLKYTAKMRNGTVSTHPHQRRGWVTNVNERKKKLFNISYIIESSAIYPVLFLRNPRGCGAKGSYNMHNEDLHNMFSRNTHTILTAS